MTLLDFLRANENANPRRIEEKSIALVGMQRALQVPKSGWQVFLTQFLHILGHSPAQPAHLQVDRAAMITAANAGDEPAIAAAAGRPDDVAIAQSAGAHGKELQDLGYTLSHVVHAYGAICQAITEIAIEHDAAITTQEFRALNRCTDTAIAGAVTAFQAERNESLHNSETQHTGLPGT